MTRILCIEDDPLNMRLISKFLQASGYELLTAWDGTSGVERALKECPDIVLVDINLPDIDGMEVVTRLRKAPELKQVPIIAVTASVFSGDQAHFIAAGFDAFVPKPIRRRDFLSIIADNLLKRHLNFHFSH